MSFHDVPRPVWLAVRQTNGPLAIVEDDLRWFWIINRNNGKAVPEQFDGLEAAQAEASRLSVRHRDGESCLWTVPVFGPSADVRFAYWMGG